MAVVHTVNIFSFQSVSQEAEKDLKSLQILPSENNPADQSKTKPVPASESKNVSSESVKNAQDQEMAPSKPKKDTDSSIDDFDF